MKHFFGSGVEKLVKKPTMSAKKKTWREKFVEGFQDRLARLNRGI
jgi:hypothetical protein